MNAQTQLFLDKTKQAVHDFFDLNLWVKNIKEHAPQVSAETMGWVAVILLHLATIPTFVCVAWIVFIDSSSTATLSPTYSRIHAKTSLAADCISSSKEIVSFSKQP